MSRDENSVRELARLSESLKNSADSIKALSDKLSPLCDRMMKLETQLAGHTTSNGEAKADTKSDIARMTADLSQLKADVQTLCDEASTIGSALPREVYESKHSALVSRITGLETTRIANLEAKVNEYDQMIKKVAWKFVEGLLYGGAIGGAVATAIVYILKSTYGW